MMMVKLNRPEMAHCKQLASARYFFSKATGVTNMKRDDSRSDMDIDLLGTKAELAVAKLFKIDMNMAMVGIDDGIDLFHYDVGIDVKSTFHAGGRMLFKSLDAFRADVCVLATATDDDDVINVVGWLPRSHWRKMAKPFRAGGYSTGMAVDQKDLLPLPDLWQALMTKFLKGDQGCQ